MRPRGSYKLQRVSATLLATAATFLGGCAGVPFVVRAARFHDPQPKHLAYQIVGARPGLNPSDPTFTALAGYVRTALSSKGFFEAPVGVPAGLTVEIDFGMDPPRTITRTHEEDIVETIPEKTVTKTRTTKRSDGTTVSETTTEKIAAHDEVTGHRTVTNTVILYPKFLRLFGYEPAGAGPPRRMWLVDVTNDDEVNSLDAYLLLLVAAAMDYINVSLPQPRTVFVSLHDRRADFLQRGIFP